MNFTQAELKRIKLALIKENIKLEYDLELGDFGNVKKQIMESSIKSNENLIKKIEKEMK